MIYIIKNVVRKQIRNRTIMIIAILALILTSLIITGDGLKINGKEVLEFDSKLKVTVSLVIFFASMLTIFLSMNIIPQEFKEKTSHLILVRPIVKWQYMLALVLGNLIVSLIILGVLSCSIIVLLIFFGKLELLFRLIITLLILGLNIGIISTTVSIVSIKLPAIFAGLAGFVIYILGMMHNYLSTFSQLSESIWWTKPLLILTPDILGVQQEAALFLSGRPINLHIILGLTIYLYLIFGGTFFLFPKEV